MTLQNIHQFFVSVATSRILYLLIIAVVLDTILGVLRAIKQHKFNSCVGIDGAIRKVAMLVSAIVLAAVDMIVHTNLIGFIPETYRTVLSMPTVGICELFTILFLAYECISILKNMLLCGLPVPSRARSILEKFLDDMTAEMPDDK